MNFPRLLATWFGAGLLPKAPGTWGSVAALPFAWLLMRYGGASVLAIATILVFAVGWWASDKITGAEGIDDPGFIVIDEVAGQWLVLLAAPLDWRFYLAGLALFRLFDVWKPWPAGWADRNVKGGLGVMIDDIFAAIYGVIIMAALRYFLVK